MNELPVEKNETSTTEPRVSHRVGGRSIAGTQTCTSSSLLSRFHAALLWLVTAAHRQVVSPRRGADHHSGRMRQPSLPWPAHVRGTMVTRQSTESGEPAVLRERRIDIGFCGSTESVCRTDRPGVAAYPLALGDNLGQLPQPVVVERIDGSKLLDVVAWQQASLGRRAVGCQVVDLCERCFHLPSGRSSSSSRGSRSSKSSRSSRSSRSSSSSSRGSRSSKSSRSSRSSRSSSSSSVGGSEVGVVGVQALLDLLHKVFVIVAETDDPRSRRTDWYPSALMRAGVGGGGGEYSAEHRCRRGDSRRTWLAGCSCSPCAMAIVSHDFIFTSLLFYFFTSLLLYFFTSLFLYFFIFLFFHFFHFHFIPFFYPPANAKVLSDRIKNRAKGLQLGFKVVPLHHQRQELARRWIAITCRAGCRCGDDGWRVDVFHQWQSWWWWWWVVVARWWGVAGRRREGRCDGASDGGGDGLYGPPCSAGDACCSAISTQVGREPISPGLPLVAEKS